MAERGSIRHRRFTRALAPRYSPAKRGLTSEFGMGSGVPHALWPVTTKRIITIKANKFKPSARSQDGPLEVQSDLETKVS